MRPAGSGILVGLTVCLLVAGSASNATSTPAPDLSMKFEVSFLKIDVAMIEAYLGNGLRSRLLAAVAGRAWSRDVRRDMEAVLGAADTVSVSMRLLRDAGYGRFQGGLERGIEAARKSGLIDEEDETAIVAEYRAEFAGLAERGVKEGDVFWDVVTGDDIRSFLVTARGDTLVNMRRSGAGWTPSVLGTYFGRESNFSDKLCRSFVERRPSR